MSVDDDFAAFDVDFRARFERRMLNDYYILVGHNVEPAASITQWALAYENDNRVVRQDRLGRIIVSTVFLGMDHNFTRDGAPKLFETMVFGGPLDQYIYRCATWEQAEAQHGRAFKAVRRTLPAFDWLLFRYANWLIPTTERVYGRWLRRVREMEEYDSGLRAYGDEYRFYRARQAQIIAQIKAEER